MTELAPLTLKSEAAVAEKSLLRLLTCGSVDDGKSTLIGRLLFDSKSLMEDQLEALQSRIEELAQAVSRSMVGTRQRVLVEGSSRRGTPLDPAL